MTETPEYPRPPKQQTVETADFLRELLQESPEFASVFDPDRWLEVEHVYLNLMQRLGVKTK
jgi:hypothetical protein